VNLGCNHNIMLVDLLIMLLVDYVIYLHNTLRCDFSDFTIPEYMLSINLYQGSSLYFMTGYNRSIEVVQCD